MRTELSVVKIMKMAASTADEGGKTLKRRFGALNEEEYQTLLINKDSDNTKKATKGAVKIFRDYLVEKGLSSQFEDFDVDKLNGILCQFYAEARTQEGECYKKTPLECLRHGINRHLNAHNGIDIIKDIKFDESKRVFLAVKKDLKRQGLGGVVHYPPMDDRDLTKMYEHLKNDDPEILQQKVFVDIGLHFGRRGRENWRELKVSDFACTTDADGMRYIYMVSDELTKNHQDSTNTADGRMYEMKDDEKCPVRSFMKYKKMLNPKAPFLFQRLSTKPNGKCWFDNAPIGCNKLGHMMPTISKNSFVTSHCCSPIRPRPYSIKTYNVSNRV